MRRKKYTKIPAISGKKLIRLLKKDGWNRARNTSDGMCLKKKVGNRIRVTYIDNTSKSLPIGTLMAILSDKQTGLGKKGLLELINRYGL
ncbi:MAG TPA: hypothetical protein ENI52_01300 [Thermoplasmata archaeon]|nr:hypothetical protein [Thermoplasmata archaeon]